MTARRITYTIEHVPTELGNQGFARMILWSEGARGSERVCHANFGCDNPTSQEVHDKFFSECRWLSTNPCFAKWQNELSLVGYW